MIPKPNGGYWDKGWNPIKMQLDDGYNYLKGGYHCTHCSPGCAHCWAEALNKRFGNGIPYDNREVRLEIDENTLAQPAKWRKPQIVFVCHLMDLFHEQVPDEVIFQVFKAMANAPQHRFLVLTKRPERMLNITPEIHWRLGGLDHIYLGVTICNQQEADYKIPLLLLNNHFKQNWLSIEPMLGAVEIPQEQLKQLDWVVVGGESGKGARPMHPDWVRKVCNDCQEAGTPFYFKQYHKKSEGRLLDGKEWNQLPEGLML